jgi:hypothetical protein
VLELNCWLHSATVLCRRLIARGLARQIAELASASGGRTARRIPGRRRDLSYGAGPARGEIGLLPARDKAAARSSGSRWASAPAQPPAAVAALDEAVSGQQAEAA